MLACSGRSDSEARAKNIGSERAGKKRGETGEALSPSVFFPRAPPWERLEQATKTRFTCTTKAVPMPWFIFQFGLKFEFNYMTFFSQG